MMMNADLSHSMLMSNTSFQMGEQQIVVGDGIIPNQHNGIVDVI